MSKLIHREGLIIVPNANTATQPDLGANYDVTVYEPGGIANGSATSNEPTLHAGHGFAALDKFIVGTDTSKFHEVESVTSTSIKLTNPETVTYSNGDVFVNLGPDTGTTSPKYDKSPLSIYTNPNGDGTAITSARIEADGSGQYEYWHNPGEIWELVRNSSNVPVAIIPDAGKGGRGTRRDTLANRGDAEDFQGQWFIENRQAGSSPNRGDQVWLSTQKDDGTWGWLFFGAQE